MSRIRRWFHFVILIIVFAAVYIFKQKGALRDLICRKHCSERNMNLVSESKIDVSAYASERKKAWPNGAYDGHGKQGDYPPDQEIIETLKILIDDLIELRVSLDGNTARKVEEKYSKFQNMLRRMEASSKPDKNEEQNTESKNDKTVYSCPEVRNQYNKKFERGRCKKVAIANSVSIIIDSPSLTKKEKDKLMKDIRIFDSKIRIFTVSEKHDKTFSRPVQINKFIRQTQTPFVYIARNLHSWDFDFDLERLIHFISTVDKVAVVGGAVLNVANGYWSHGCYQTRLKNYTLVYERGYWESKSSCVKCDYLPGPFIARLEYLIKFPFSEELFESYYEDLFLRMKQCFDDGRNEDRRKGRRENKRSKECENNAEQRAAIFSCPDVQNQALVPQISASDLKDLAEKWEIKKIVGTNGNVYWFGCKRGIKHRMPKCRIGRGMAVPPCCLENLADAIKFIMKTCEFYGIACELTEGTLLGAVKFRKLLPWERDADILFLSQDFDKLHALQDNFKKERYSLIIKEMPRCCTRGRKTGGTILIKADGWNIEMIGKWTLNSYEKLKVSQKPTKIEFAGQMVNVPNNPGKVSRNRYGKEIYKHAEHWMHNRMNSGWDEYSPGSFNECERPGHHGCLNQYKADGSLQFEG